MPGIIGFCGYAEPQMVHALSERMAAALCDEPWYKTEMFADECVGLGRVHLQIVNTQPQPLRSSDGNIALVMVGEIYSWDGFDPAPDALRSDPAGGVDNAQILLAAYLHFGECFVQHVNGSFAAAFWHVRERRLLLVTDHIGSHPLYYAQVRERIVFGSGARAVAQAPDLPLAVNRVTMAQILAFEHALGDETLFAGVHLLPPATLLRFEDGRATCTTYEDFQYPEYYESHDEDYYIDQLVDYIRQAVARQTRGPAPLGVLLTGGLDSRTLLAMLDRTAFDLVTMTFGQPGCDDLRYAREVARALHVPHQAFVLPADYLMHQAAHGVRLTDGLKSCIHMNMLGCLDQVTQQAKVLYKGFLGGTIYGYVVERESLLPLRDDDWFAAVFKRRNRVFRPHEAVQLYSEPMGREVADVPVAGLRAALARSKASFWVDKDSYFDLYEEDVRFTLLGVELARSRAQVRTPLADKDLLRFAAGVPPGFRMNQHTFRQAFAKAFPQLAKFPSTTTGYPLLPCFRDLQMRADEQMRWWLRNHGWNWVPVPQERPYADYAGWLRGVLRPWVEETLLVPQSLDRGYFQPAYIRKLVAEHMAGQEHTHKLGVLLTLELWHQQFVD